MNFLKGSNQKTSAKRVFAIGCFIAGVYSGCVNRDSVTCGIFIGAALASLGIGAITKT